MQNSQNSNVTILMVDDDDVDVLAVARALKRANINNPLVIAHDGQDALERLRAQQLAKPFLVLLDLNMPRMNGIEFLKSARQDESLKNSVIFVLTTSASQQDRDSAYEHNVAGYMVKDRDNGGFMNVAELVRQYTSYVEFPS